MKRLEFGRGVFMVSAVLLVSAAGAATTVTTNASNEVTYNVPAGETYVENGSWNATIAKVTKTGGGTLELKASHPDFKGKTLDIMSGYVKTAQTSNPVGTSTIKISKGAALWYTGGNPGQTARIFEKVEIAGDGPDGKGAFYRDTVNAGDQLIKYLTLTDGATIGGKGRFGVWTLDMGGFTLTNAVTYSADSPLMFLQTYMKNPGHIVQKSRKVTIQSPNDWGNATADNTWTMDQADAMLTFWSTTIPFPWKILAKQNFKLVTNQDGLELSGPIALNGKTMTVQNNSETPRTIVLSGDITGGGISKQSDSLTVRMADADHTFSSISGSNGDLVISGGVHQVVASNWGSVGLMNGSSLSFIDAGEVSAGLGVGFAIYNTGFSIWRKPSRADFVGKTHYTCLEPSSFTIINIGGKRETSDGGVGWGVMSVRDGAAVTNGFALAPKGRGALYVKDATVYSRSGFWFDVAGNYSPGPYRYGFLGIDGGRFESWGGMRTSVTTNAESHVVMHGGVLQPSRSSLRIGSSDYGNFYADGGRIDLYRETYDTIGQIWLGERNAFTGGEGIFTLDNCATAKVERLLHKTHTNYLAQVNVNNGAYLGVNQVWNVDVNSARGSAADGARSIFSFDGGIVSYYNGWMGGQNLFTDEPDAVVVHAGGMTVNVAEGDTCVVKVPLERPRAKSFKSISLPTDGAFLAKKFIGPVRLVIEGPGEGASAFIDFDVKTETLGNVVITSKGSGYDETTKVWAIPHESPKERYECAYELQEETTGVGLTKTGPGTFCLDGTNTYAGATVVNGGALYGRTDWAFPSNTAVRVNNSAILNLAQCLCKFSSIGGNGGSINGAKNGGALTVDDFDFADAGAITLNGVSKVVVEGTMTVDCADLAANAKTGRQLSVSVPVEFASAAKIRFVNVDKLDEADGKYKFLSAKSFTGTPTLVNPEVFDGVNWSYRVRANDLSVSFNRGSLLIVR